MEKYRRIPKNKIRRILKMNKDYFDWRFGITRYYQFAIKAPWSGMHSGWAMTDCVWRMAEWSTQTDYWVVDAWGLWYTAYCVSILGCRWWLGAYCNLYACGDSDRGAWTPHKNPDGFLPDLAGGGFGKTEREWWLIQCVMGLAQDNKVSKFQHVWS